MIYAKRAKSKHEAHPDVSRTCRRVRARAPTEVANELATSFAPIPQAIKMQVRTPTAKIHCRKVFSIMEF